MNNNLTTFLPEEILPLRLRCVNKDAQKTHTRVKQYAGIKKFRPISSAKVADTPKTKQKQNIKNVLLLDRAISINFPSFIASF
ncbi:MAG: hypothetical protein ABH832_01750 [bacterium]